MTPYYEDEWVTIYHGDCRDVAVDADVLVTDPPFGISYESGRPREDGNPNSITGDDSTAARDWAIGVHGRAAALVFGSWKVPRPAGTRAVLVWDGGGALGMGDLSIPWKPCWQEIYVIGAGFDGPRTSGVLRYPAVQSMAANGRVHPHEKPVDLMGELVAKCPPGTIIDPFMGSGTTLVAAKNLGRRAIGIEIEERYCEIAAERCSQGVLNLASGS